ncbi:MAG TPA: NAD(P)/FAD-dependent oxidoreductase [Longimicrobiales bacterium]
MNIPPTDYDAIIIGGGPAGLSAGLWLARYRRRVVILDSGKPRNDPTWAVHGYPGLVDPPPHELRRVLIDQATEAGAEWRAADVDHVSGEKNNFAVHLEDGSALTARRVILAHGKRDNLPDIPGARELYGHSIFHCPDCDGPSVTGKRVGVFGWNRSAALLALYLLTWAESTTLFTNGREPELKKKELKVLAKYHVPIRTERIDRFRGVNDCLVAVDLALEQPVPIDAIFFHLGSPLATDIANRLGCKRERGTDLKIDRAHQTTVPGIFAAGDIVGPPYLAITAAAKGVTAAMGVHRSLLPPDQEL